MYEAEIKDGKVVVEDNPEEVFQLGGYGKMDDGELELKAYEAMNLVRRGKLEILEDGEVLSKEEFYRRACDLEEDFPQKNLVYGDLRKSGYRVRPGYSFPADLRVYERGTSFSEDGGKTNHVKWLMDVVRTDSTFSLSESSEKLRGARNVRASYAMGIVDEEGDVTYYKVNQERKLDEDGKWDAEGDTITGYKKGNWIVVWDEDDIDEIYQPRYFGKRRNGRLDMNYLESLYLQEKGILEVEDGGDILDVEEFRELAREEDVEFGSKYRVYRDLRDKGFLVRAGFKFGTHFRVYDRGVELKKGQKSPDEHTRWVVHAVQEDLGWSYPELSRFVRLALNIRSKPTLAALNDEIKYYRVVRITP